MPSHKPEYGNFFQFDEGDFFHNRVKTYPKVEFFIYSGSIYYNNENQNSINSNTPNGCINLYELNVHRSNDLIHPFITKEGSFTNFKTISTSEFNHDFVYGDTLSGSYPLTASISIDRYAANPNDTKKKVLYALRTSLDYHSKISMHYAYSSDEHGSKENQPLNIISIPSIFYGSSIKKGSVVLKYYITGTIAAEASDINKNGELIQTSGSSTGQAIGVVLYNEGFIMLTSSANISTHTEKYLESADENPVTASWHYFGVTSSALDSPSSSFGLDFKGVNYINTLTMLAHAKENQLNFSNNASFLLTSSVNPVTTSVSYVEPKEAKIKNIVSSSYTNYSASYQPVTYISKIALYDQDKNLIAIAGLANPVKKIEERSYTFKLKLDI